MVCWPESSLNIHGYPALLFSNWYKGCIVFFLYHFLKDAQPYQNYNVTRLHLLAKDFCCATCISWKYWCRCPGLCCGGATLDRALVGWKRTQRANGNQGDPQGSSAWQSAAGVKGQTKRIEQSVSFVLQKKQNKKKHMQMHKMFQRVFNLSKFCLSVLCYSCCWQCGSCSH